MEDYGEIKIDDEGPFTEALAASQAAQAAYKAALPDLTQARRQFFKLRTPEAQAEMERQEARVGALFDALTACIDTLTTVSGVDPQLLAAIEAEEAPRGVDRRARSSLTADQVRPSADLDARLPSALEALLTHIPTDWLQDEPADAFRLSRQADPDAFVSIVKGVRRESEFPTGHRLRQAVVNCRDYLDHRVDYDHFAGATNVSTLTKLGGQLETLNAVGGDVEGRLKSLWNGPSAKVDATIFELLVAAACAEVGTGIEFLKETSEKSPDMRAHDPFPALVECKRRQALSQYEIDEEKVLRDLFARLAREARARGLCARFRLTLKVEASALDIEEVATRMIAQRLAASPERPQDYSWGTVALEPLARRIALPTVTKAYSPAMLEHVFGWTFDLPLWDGLLARFDVAEGQVTDEAAGAVGLLWTNVAEASVVKRAWAPINLFADASKQIHHGDVGIIYVAYNEGARPEVADLRIQNYIKRLADFEHSSNLRIPITQLVRLLPRPMDHGNPDLIESTLQFVSAEYGHASLFEDFPSNVFTDPGD